ncbi:zinc-dependent alcohol dehydrogenase [Actinomadura scrupuli]|uniref:zinc-dependent alcohol dehydrogenase n=1 Tax=Actinomadura scrupuli TaxID=559629 RepID=UPI003D98478C
MSTRMMRAARYHGPRDVRIESGPVPAPGASEVLVRVLRSGICGTDASEYDHGPMMVPLRSRHPGSGHRGPIILGHEFAGLVVESGPGAEGLLGKRVATGAGVSCGECRWCRKGRTNLCAGYWTLGLSADGGMAQYAVVPASTCVLVPDDCGDDSAGLAQPLAVGLHAARRAGVEEGDTVVLVGAGAIGSFALCGLTGHRPGRIIALDVDPERLAMAGRLGATETHDVGGLDPVPLVRELTGGAGADVVVEATGADGSAQRAVRMAARGGRVLLVGLPHGPQPIELAEATLREVDVSTTVAHVCGEDMPEALDLLTDGSLAELVLERVIGLDDLVPEGLDALLQRRLRGKVLVDPWA